MNVDIISVYTDVLNSKRFRFPPETWEPHKGGFDNFRRCVTYLIQVKLLLSRETVLNTVSVSWFRKWKLGGAFELFDQSPYKAIAFAFPDWEIKPWEVKSAPQNTWDEKTLIEATRWLFNEKLNWGREEIANQVNRNLFVEHGMYKLLVSSKNLEINNCLSRDRSGIYEILKLSFPEYDFKVHELKNVWKWEEGDIKESLRVMVEIRLQWSYEDIIKNMTIQTFKDNGGFNILTSHFKNSPYLAMKFLYPDKDWEMLKRNMRKKKLK